VVPNELLLAGLVILRSRNSHFVKEGALESSTVKLVLSARQWLSVELSGVTPWRRSRGYGKPEAYLSYARLREFA
jgi:hypothetical protein